MAEFLARLRWIWIENGDTVATVIFVVAVAVMLIVALSRSGKESNQ